MEQQCKGYLIAATDIRPNNSVVEGERIKDNGITFDLNGVAARYGMFLRGLVIDHCLPSPTP